MEKASKQPGEGKVAGVYIHIPFCMAKCPYCDFYSTTNLKFLGRFAEALLLEMEMAPHTGLKFDTIYIGGGTPSVLEPGFVGKLIEKVKKTFNLSPGAEITIEVNPGTVDPERLAGYRQSGVNRINIGVQSFHDKHLAFLGRIHSAKDADLAIIWARSAGFDNLGLDLIYGLPGQTEASWKMDMEKAVQYQPEHLSCYMLSYETGTPMEKDLKMGRFTPLEEEATGDLFESTIANLDARGYSQYEISNFALRPPSPERSDRNRSRHNQKYWSFTPYIGLGPSAHSFVDPHRFWNHRSVERYLSDIDAGRLPVQEMERLNAHQSMIETVYLGLRTTEGLDMADFDDRFGNSFEDSVGDILTRLETSGHLKSLQSRLALTPKGMRFLDSIASMFVGML